MEILSSNYNCNTLLEFLQEVQEYQDSSIFQTVFIKGIQKLRQAGFYILPTEGKVPKVKFQTIEDKERANKAKIDTEASLVLPDWLAIIDIEDPSFLNIDWDKIATVRTGRGYHVYVIKEDFFQIVKDSSCELRFGENFLVVLPGSRFWSEKHQTVFYKVCNPKIYLFSELPEKLREWFSEKWSEKRNFQNKEESFEKGSNGHDKFSVTVDWTRLKEIVLQNYFEGQRQNLVLFLSGWLASLGVNQKEVEDFIYEICMETADKEWRMRMEAVKKTYEKVYRKEEIKGFQGLVELGFVAEELDSCIRRSEKKARRQYDLLGKMEFVVSDWHLYQVVRRKKGQEEIEEWEEVGPYIEIVEKRIWLEPKPQARYLVRYKNQVALWEEMSSLSEIEKFTGKKILNEKIYKRWLNARFTEIERKKTILVVKQTGWKGNRFFHPALPSLDDVVFDGNHILLKEDRAKYKNPDLQHEIIKKLLEEGKGLGFLLLCGISSVFLTKFKLKPFLTILTGPSGAGKTLAASFISHLFYDSRDIILTANTTPVGLELTMKSLKNLPVLMDEGALKGRLSLEELVFMIASGKGRARGTINLTVLIHDIESVVFYTSEVLDSDEFRKSGAFRRCIRLSIKSWEDLSSAVSMEEIRKVMQKACGAGLDYIQVLSTMQEKDIEALEEHLETYTPIFYSQANIIKAITLALYFMQNFYQTEFLALQKYIMNFFENAKQEYEEEEKDMVRKFFNRFSQFVARHSNNFADRYRTPGGEVYGKIEQDRVYILTSVFENFCREYGFERKVLLQLLAEKNLIEKAPDGKYRTPKKIGKTLASTYCIILPNE